LAASPYNFYFDDSYRSDRILLVAGSLLATWLPATLPIFVAHAAAFVGQFDRPLPSIGSEFLVLTDLLWLCTLVSLANLGRKSDSRLLVAVVSLYWVTQYSWAGLNKLTLGPLLSWISENHLSDFVSGAMIHRVSLLPPGISSVLEKWLDVAQIPAAIAVVSIEMAGLAFLTHRKAPFVCFALWIGLHVTTFAISGVLYWQWIVVNIAFAILFAMSDVSWLVSRRRVAILLLPLAMYAFRSKDFAWYDVPIENSYEFELVSHGGAATVVSPSVFAPYEILYATRGFTALSGRRRIPIVYSTVSDHSVFRELEAVRTHSDLEEADRRFGALGASREGETLERFVARYLDNVRKAPEKLDLWYTKIGPPPSMRVKGRSLKDVDWTDVRSVRVVNVRAVHSPESGWDEVRSALVGFELGQRAR
jgi:hypothetical protein